MAPGPSFHSLARRAGLSSERIGGSGGGIGEKIEKKNDGKLGRSECFKLSWP